MAIQSSSNNKGLAYRSLPRDSRDKSDSQYFLDYCRAVWYRYKNGYSTELKYNSAHLKLLAKYAEGTQGAVKVKEKLLKMHKDGTFKGYMKDVFQTFDILPELIDIMMATNMKSDYRPTSQAIDRQSIKDRELEMGIAKFLVQEQTKDMLSYMGMKIESVLTEEEISVYNDVDVEVMFKTGGIQLQREIEAVAACNDAMAISRHKEIENQTTYDLIRYGIASVKVYWDYAEEAARYRYVDPERLVVPQSKYNDFRDISYAGEWRFMRLHEIYSESPSLRPDQLTELIRNNASYNASFGGYLDNETIEGYVHGRNEAFDEYLIPVLDVEWLASDMEVNLISKTSNDGYIYKRVKRDYELDRKQRKNNDRLDKKKFVKKYHAIWVVGSEILLHYGRAKDNTYYGPKGRRVPHLDYTVWKTGKRSLVDRVRTVVDDINLNVAKHRSAIASLPPGPGLIIYEHALQNIKFGKTLQSPRDLIDGLVQGGVLIVNGRDSRGNYIASNGGKAVDQIPPFAMQQIAVFSAEISNQVNRLRQLLGLPEGLDGTTGSPYTGVGQVQLAAMASSNALFPTLSGIGPLFEQTMEKVVKKRQLMVKRGSTELRNISDSNRYKVLSLSKDFSNYDFKIRIMFAPTDEEKTVLLQQINEMALAYVQSGGTVGCSKAEFFMLYKLIRANLFDEAMYQVARIEKMREQTNIRIQRENMLENGRQNNESIELNKQARLEEIAEENRQKRLGETAKALDESVSKLTAEYLKSHDRENSAIPAQLYNRLVDRAEQDRLAVEEMATAPPQPNQPIEEPLEAQPML